MSKMERIVRVLSAMTIGRSPFFDVKRLRATSRAIAAGRSGAGRRYSRSRQRQRWAQHKPVLTLASATHDDSQVGHHAAGRGQGVVGRVRRELAKACVTSSSAMLHNLRQRAREEGREQRVHVPDLHRRQRDAKRSRSSPVRLASYASAAAASSAVRASGGL